MIDTKYGLKYPMPHSVVHIVDNSAYTGELPVVVAEDPSLYSAIVVTGLPMGDDNKMVTVLRDDVLNTAYGVQSMTVSDLKKYGQTASYASSLIRQGAPVRLMRVTPEGSTYALSCIAMLWREPTANETDNLMHVRFEQMEFPLDVQLDKFKNTARLNETLVKTFNTDNYVTEDGYTWKRRVFINFISAGRGKVYNYMANAINPTIQAKKPTNVQYEFVTIDTRTNVTCERFYASLVNTNSANAVNSIDSVNTIVAKRVSGSSVVVPYVNEKAIHELYADYMKHFTNLINTIPTDEYVKAVYKTLDVNTFDVLYGKYLYNGSDTGMTLPFYQVDMYNTDIPRLDEMHRVTTAYDTFDVTTPVCIYDQLTPFTYGVTRSGDNVYVGDIYLTATGNSTSKPTLNIVGAINQYTGAVTYLSLPNVYLIDTAGEITSTSVSITTIFNDATVDGAGSKTLNNLVTRGILTENSVVAQLTSDGGFKLYVVTSVSPTVTTGDKYTLVAYTKEQVYQALDWNQHSSGATGTGNVIAHSTTSAAYNRIGAVVIDETGKILVNGYDYNEDTQSGRIEITNNRLKFGTCPTDVNITTDIIGAEYDVLAYESDSAVKWTINSVTVMNGGSGYVVGDVVNATVTSDDATTVTSNTKFTVTEVDESGAVVAVSVDGTSVESVNFAGVGVATTGGTGTDLLIGIEDANLTPVEYAGTPKQITRYIVSGVQGSLFRVTKEPIDIYENYYSDQYGINLTSEVGGVRLSLGSTGFFDDETMSEIEFKWRYSALLVKAYRGEIDPRIMSPNRVPAKYLFDGGHNTIVGQTILPYMTYTPADIINASTIFTEDEKEEILFNPDTISNITDFEDIDVKQAMYDLMIYRCYQGIPDDKRPIGPGSGLSLFLDSGVTDATTAMLINTSFAKRFDNPNASWDIGGWVDLVDGMTYTFTKQIVDNLVTHSKTYSVNKPYTGKYTSIPSTRYISYFPDIDVTDWELRELLYNSGGNAWIADHDGNLTRRSQRTLLRTSDSSDLIQESNMRTLSQLVYLLQNEIDGFLLEYDDDGVLKTMSDKVNNKFSPWIGNLVDGLTIEFKRDKNIDGGDIVVCYVAVTFRGLILRVPIIVNVNRRES